MVVRIWNRVFIDKLIKYAYNRNLVCLMDNQIYYHIIKRINLKHVVKYAYGVLKYIMSNVLYMYIFCFPYNIAQFLNSTSMCTVL